MIVLKKPMAENLHIGFLSSLKSAVTEGIDYGIYLLLLLAQGAVTEAVGLIIRHILPCKNGVDRNGMCLIYRAENRVDGADFAAVILDTLDTLIQGFSGGGCSQQPRCRLCFILARLQCGQVNVIIDVGMFSLFPVTQNATGLLTTRSHYYFFLV